MKFSSRLHPRQQVTFREAIFSGLAPDGGLYHPVEHPDLAALFSEFNEGTAFVDLAAAVTAGLLAPEIDAAAARRICERAFSFAPRLRRIDANRLLLELYHGPTCAFKDFGARFLAAAMEELLAGERCQILVATSGDTGSAVAHAFHGRRGIDVIILYPSGRVSALQEQQLTTLGGNVHALEIRGSFDDCQRLVKAAFQDERLRGALCLTSANSISIGRLLPQSFYYIHAALQRSELGGLKPLFCVPSGNFGDLTAGLYAWRWGLPAASFIAATNCNDVVPEYLQTGVYRPRPSIPTLSNAMDVGHPSNLERMEVLFDGDWRAMAGMIRAGAVSDERTLSTMNQLWREQGVIVDPHTAVGCAVAGDYMEGVENKDEQIVVLATAHPGKFGATVKKATGVEVELPEQLARSLTLPKQAVPLGATLLELSDFLLERFAWAGPAECDFVSDTTF